MAQTTDSSGKTSDSLADSARKHRPNDAHTSTKRNWTDDDFSHSKESSAVSMGTLPESSAESLRKFRLLDKEELGAAILRLEGVPNVNFSERRNWEQRLFDAKQTWIDQVARMEGHKDSSKEVQVEEIRLSTGAQKNFERVARDGVKQAKAVNDPVLRAHMEYERRTDFCKQTTGDLFQQCLAGTDKFKSQMQREGTW
jgi:hypothetical protein